MYDIRSLNIWKKEEQKNQNEKGLREIDISEIYLSVRSYNCLKRAGCDTVGDILDFLDEEGNGLRKIRNLGSRSEKEIKEILEDLQKEYRTRPDQASGPVQKLVRPAKKALGLPIDDFHLTGNTYRRLRAAGIYYVKDLYDDGLTDEPGWFAVRELFEQILAK